jgi:hypothetical protein
LLRFNGSDRNGNGASPAGFVPSEEVGSAGAAITRRAPREAVRLHVNVLVRPFRRGGRGQTRRVEARRRAAIWTSPGELEGELNRSRRYGRTFALVRIPCRVKATGRSNAVNGLGHALSSLVRYVDRVWVDGTSVYVLLPECDRAMAKAMLARIREPLAELLSAEERKAISSVVFPDDGVTAGALFNALDRPTISVAGRREQLEVVPSPPEVPVA